jgi:chromosome segregation ATPase
MSEQTTSTLLSRIGRWFKRGDEAGGPAHANGDHPVIGEPGAHPNTALETRTTFLRPWAKRDAAIQHLQEGFTTLTDLMGAIRDNLEKQNQRQDELMGALTQLPQVLQSLPENSRVHTETLQVIRQQIEGQSAQQERLGVILERIGQTTGEQRQMVDALRDRVEDLHKTDTSIADYLNNVGQSMKDVSSNSKTTSEVLGQMRDNIAQRDGQIERVLQKQNVRFTTMLAAAIFLSIAALVAVCVIGYVIVNNGHLVK